MAPLLLLMVLVCLGPVLTSLAFVAFDPGTRNHRRLVGLLGGLFGFLLGLIAVFCGVMIPLASAGLSGQRTGGAGLLTGAVEIGALVAALMASLLAYILTRKMARAIASKDAAG